MNEEIFQDLQAQILDLDRRIKKLEKDRLGNLLRTLNQVTLSTWIHIAIMVAMIIGLLTKAIPLEVVIQILKNIG